MSTYLDQLKRWNAAVAEVQAAHETTLQRNLYLEQLLAALVKGTPTRLPTAHVDDQAAADLIIRHDGDHTIVSHRANRRMPKRDSTDAG